MSQDYLKSENPLEETSPCVLRSALLGILQPWGQLCSWAERKDGLVREAMWRCFGKAGDGPPFGMCLKMCQNPQEIAVLITFMRETIDDKP